MVRYGSHDLFWLNVATLSSMLYSENSFYIGHISLTNYVYDTSIYVLKKLNSKRLIAELSIGCIWSNNIMGEIIEKTSNC